MTMLLGLQFILKLLILIDSTCWINGSSFQLLSFAWKTLKEGATLKEVSNRLYIWGYMWGRDSILNFEIFYLTNIEPEGS